MEAACTGHTGTFTGAYTFSPICNIFSPTLSINEDMLSHPDFRMFRDGKPVMSLPARRYLFRKYIDHLEQEERWAELESRAYYRDLEKRGLML